MSLADERFEQFVDSIRAGRRVDHGALFDGLDRAGRLELADLIDGFTASERSAPVDLESFEVTRNDDPNLERLGRAMNGVSGMWPAALPRLRNRARIGREELVAKLADEIGAPDRREKVEEYYHRMEWGSLPASGVNDRVVESLAGILGADPADLRRSGDFRGAASTDWVEDESPAVFARLVGPGQAVDASNGPASPGTGSGMTDLPSPEDWDETDRLFLGG